MDDLAFGRQARLPYFNSITPFARLRQAQPDIAQGDFIEKGSRFSMLSQVRAENQSRTFVLATLIYL